MSKRGHPQFRQLRSELHNGPESFGGYPHRRHRKGRPMFQRSEISRIRESAHIEELEAEIEELA